MRRLFGRNENLKLNLKLNLSEVLTNAGKEPAPFVKLPNNKVPPISS